MAKFLLLVFVIAHFLSVSLMIIDGAETSWKHTMPIWIGIAVLAICESIEKSKGVNK